VVILSDIREARSRLDGITVRTPLIPLEYDGRTLYLKPENLQPIGAFKLRGAYNKIASLTEDERARGVITYSSGNHAQGVAYAARALETKAVVVMPSNAPAIKREATAALGAEIVLVGPSGVERQLKAEELAAQYGYVIIPPYEDEKIIAGQGTAGLEILEDLPDVDLVLVPIGGGGLISGISTAIKSAKPHREISRRAGAFHLRRRSARSIRGNYDVRAHPPLCGRYSHDLGRRNHAGCATSCPKSQDRRRTQRCRCNGRLAFPSRASAGIQPYCCGDQWG